VIPSSFLPKPPKKKKNQNQNRQETKNPKQKLKHKKNTSDETKQKSTGILQKSNRKGLTGAGSVGMSHLPDQCVGPRPQWSSLLKDRASEMKREEEWFMPYIHCLSRQSPKQETFH